MRFFLVLLLLQSSPSLAFKNNLIGGEEVQPGTYEEVVRVTSGSAWCTGTMIGKQVLLTAAHCVSAGGSLRFVFKGETYNSVCSHAPDFRLQVGDQDMALCKVDKEFPGALASVSPEGPALGEEVILIGYGCVNPGGGGGNDGILRVGKAPVTRQSTEEYYSFHTQGSSALCFGDSGGPSFQMAEETAHHYVMGVNSRGNIQDVSLLTAVYHPKSVEYMRQFETEQGVEICGVTAKCDVVPEDPNKCAAEKKLVKRRKRLLLKAEQKLEQCLAT